MRKLLLVLALLSPVLHAATIPNFICTDIRGDTWRTNESYYTRMSIEQVPASYEIFKYATDEKRKYYSEINVVNHPENDGYYYGHLYSSPDGLDRFDLRCEKTK
ncbi:hypothetical protein [Serratia grimesii]|uniref:hypothetical protein n=1 Tax=Serratia grimesii TaxID=82995 RepID=UPI0039B03305